MVLHDMFVDICGRLLGLFCVMKMEFSLIFPHPIKYLWYLLFKHQPGYKVLTRKGQIQFNFLDSRYLIFDTSNICNLIQTVEFNQHF
jgi:hypothetical protein